MLIGAHVIVYSTNADADRAFLRDIVKLTHVDVGDGWLTFGLPPSEGAVHPGESNDEHEVDLMSDDIAGFVRDMKALGRACSPVQQLGWGALTSVTLPGGGKLGVYQPRHARPKPMGAAGSRAKPARAPAAKAKAKKSAKPATAKRTAKATARRATGRRR